MKNNRLRSAGRLLGVFLAGVVLTWWLMPAPESVNHADHDHPTDGTTYTCAMHPQIRQDEPGSCPLCGLALTPAARSGDGGGDEDPYHFEMSPEAVALASVQTSQVGSGEQGRAHVRTLTGKLQADEQRLAAIAATFAGRVEQLYVSFTGQQVKRGQRLATLYAPELMTAQQELREAARMRDLDPALYEAARARLRDWRLTEAQVAALESGALPDSRFDVYADRSGFVTQRAVAVGDYVTRGQVLFEVTDLSRLWVMLDAYETDLANVGVGDSVHFTVAALPGQTFRARVTYVDPVLDPNTRTAAVRAEVQNAQGTLKPEMFVSADLRSARAANGQPLTVPRSAVLWTGPRSVVFVRMPGLSAPTFEMREVTLGSGTTTAVTVLSGLTAGEEVVTRGAFAVDAAAQLSGRHSMMSRPETPVDWEMPVGFRQQLGRAIEHYFELSDALTAGEATQARVHAKATAEILAAIPQAGLSENVRVQWAAMSRALDGALRALQQTTDLTGQRQHFGAVSEQVLQVVATVGLPDQKTYQAHCPMAFDDAGGDWLSPTPQIRNPYYGAAMLTCGEIVQTFRPR